MATFILLGRGFKDLGKIHNFRKIPNLTNIFSDGLKPSTSHGVQVEDTGHRTFATAKKNKQRTIPSMNEGLKLEDDQIHELFSPRKFGG